MFNLFNRGKITGKMLRDGQSVKVTMSGKATRQDTYLILYSIIVRVALILGVPHRQLINQLITIDKKFVKAKKNK